MSKSSRKNNKEESNDPEQQVQNIWSDQEICEFVTGKVLEHPDQEEVHLSSSKIRWDIISRSKCDVKEADVIFQRMLNLGLVLCKDMIPFTEEKDSYNLTKFCNLRGWIDQN